MNLIIRKMQEKDLVVALEICREMREHHRAFLGGYFKPLDDEFEMKALRESLVDENAIALVAEVNGQVAGLLQADIKFRPYLEFEKFCHISGLGILPSFRRQGIAKVMMAEVVVECKKRGITEMSLGVFNENEGAYKLYEELGFIPLEQKMHLRIQ